MESFLKSTGNVYYEYICENYQVWRFIQVGKVFWAFSQAVDRFGNVYFRSEYSLNHLPGDCKIVVPK